MVTTCDDYVPPDSGLSLGHECRADGECGSGAHCRAPGEKQRGCGVCETAKRECGADDVCAYGLACRHYTLDCECDGETEGDVCQPVCTDAMCSTDETCSRGSGLCEPRQCDDGYACDDVSQCFVGAATADPHGCVPIRCEAGYECPPNTRCAAAADGHGCAPLGCTSDAECDCGACVNETCASGPGICTSYPV